ncbi:hypothetical protein N9954_05875 [Maribacter sp.]|nr:hypothetical protein [Maribacter sp.]
MRVILVVIIGMLLSILKTHAQDESSVTSIAQNEGSTISISVDGDISFEGDENTYFSTSDSDDTYKVRAKFNARKTPKIKDYLIEELGKKNMTSSGSTLRWKATYGGDIGYQVKLDDGSLRIFVDKELSSAELFNKFKTITRNIKGYTSGKSDKKQKEEAAKKEQDRLKREAEQKVREAESLQREAERLRREADRLEKEAKRKMGDSKKD